jgi:methionyl-tRNA formyltransferase
VPDRLRAYAPDVAVVVAFGQILPRAVLDVAPRGSINVHASLLPRYRGAAPIAWAIMRGEAETGVSIMQMDEGMDTGPVLLTVRTPIGPDETAGEPGPPRLADIGAGALVEALARLATLTPAAQPHAEATPAPRLKKGDGHRMNRPARELVNLVRGAIPGPVLSTRAPVAAPDLAGRRRGGDRGGASRHPRPARAEHGHRQRRRCAAAARGPGRGP